MKLDLSDARSAYRVKFLIKAARNFGLLDKNRYELQYRIYAITHMGECFGVSPDKIVDIDYGYEGYRK